MPDLAELFCRNAATFSSLVDRIPDDGWTNATPCSEWDVRALVNHVTSEQLWAPHLLEGQTLAEVGDRYDGDVLGDDPKGRWHAAVDGSTAAFSAPGSLDGTTHLSYGDVPATEYASQMVCDAAVHAWDLAKGIGAEARLDPDTVTALLPAMLGMRELLRGSGLFGTEVEVPDDADDATKLLGLLGREA